LRFRTAFLVIFSTLCLLPSTTAAENIDEKVYSVIHDSYRSRGMDVLMEIASQLGTAESGLAICLILSTYGGRKEKDASKLAFTSMAASALMVAVLKYAVDRERPGGGGDRWNSSFPSGHACGSMAFATVFSSYYSEYRPAFYSAAVLIAISRVYLGRHYPSDVILGAAIGYLSSKLILHYGEKLLKAEL